MMQEMIEPFKILGRNSNRLVKFFKEYEKLLEKPVENAYLLGKKLNEIEGLIKKFPDMDLKNRLITWLEHEEKRLENYKEDFRIKFAQELNALFSREGKKLRGQYPLVRIGFYTVKIDFQFGEAVLFFGPEIEKIKSGIPLQPESIFKTIQGFDRELRNVKSTPDQIFKDLYKAYRRMLKLVDKPFGERLLITRVLSEYVIIKQSEKFFVDPRKNNFKEYPRVKLSFILYLLKKSGLLERGLRFHVATFDATVDKKHSFWILESEDGEGTHYSYLSFDKEMEI